MNKRKLKLGINIALVVICIACVGVFAYAYPRLTRLKKALDIIDTEDSSSLDSTEAAADEEEEDTGYWNIALFGLDSRDEDSLTDMDTSNYGDKRSDCIMIISINRETGDVKLLSVYRDTYLQMRSKNYYTNSEYIYDKATHAYFYGSANLVPGDESIDAGPYFSIDMLERNLDIEIDNFVSVNFSVVADVIDALGGVEIELTAAEVSDINQYIDEINSIKGTSSEHITEAGTYTLDGVQATAYGRVRHTSGNDYKRTERQRTVMLLAAAKAQEADIDTLIDLVELIAPELRTDLTTTEMLSLVNSCRSYNLDEEDGSSGFPFSVLDDSSYVYADDLAANVKQLHEYLYGDTEYEVPDSVQEISDAIDAEISGTSSSSYDSNSYSDDDDDSYYYDDDDDSDSSYSDDSYYYDYSSSDESYYDSGSSDSDYSDSSSSSDSSYSDSSSSSDSSYSDSSSSSDSSYSDSSGSSDSSYSDSSGSSDSSYSDSSGSSDSSDSGSSSGDSGWSDSGGTDSSSYE